ncbi:MAG: GNAT family N-acetyltransferase, partial [Planctomycetota bacterium]
MTYFKRYRMEFDLAGWYESNVTVPPAYELLPFTTELIREHAHAKFVSFRHELDANVFPCLARRDGCLRLMRDITSRRDFVSGAT